MRSNKRIKPFLKWLESKWNESPDQRFGQLLINLGLVEDTLETWRNELNDLPIPFEVMREIQHWTSGNVEKPISKLEEEHIQNILKTQEHIKNTQIEQLLNKN